MQGSSFTDSGALCLAVGCCCLCLQNSDLEQCIGHSLLDLPLTLVQQLLELAESTKRADALGYSVHEYYSSAAQFKVANKPLLDPIKAFLAAMPSAPAPTSMTSTSATDKSKA